jgi:hypothetical protein
MLSRLGTMSLKKSTPRRRQHSPLLKTSSRHSSQVSPVPPRRPPVLVDTWATLQMPGHG